MTNQNASDQPFHQAPFARVNSPDDIPDEGGNQTPDAVKGDSKSLVVMDSPDDL